MQKEIENLEFVRGVNFEYIDSLKNNGTKYLLIFYDSCERICNSKAFVDIATAGRHRNLSTIYIKHNFFHQIKLGRDVELQNTHIVLFKSPRDVLQVTTLNTQLGLGSELVDCYRDATSVPFGHLLIDLSPRADDRLRYCTNTGSINFRYQSFVAVSGNLGGKVPVVDDVLSSHEQEIYPTTSLDENCMEFEFQTDRNCYVDLRHPYMALKLKLVRGRGYESYNTNEVKKEHKEEAKAEEEEMVEEEAPVALVTHVNNILHPSFSNVEVYIKNQQIYKSDGLYGHKSYISNNFKGAISEYKGVLHCEGYDYEEFLDEIMEAPLSEPFFTKRRQTLSRPDGFMLYGKLGVDFFSTSEFLYPSMKIGVRLIRVRPNFYMISENPNVSLGIVDCSLYTRRIVLIDDYHKKRIDMLAYTPVEFN